MKSPLLANTQQYPKSMLDKLLSNSQRATALFRIRRNKWSLLKFMIAFTVCLYLLLCLQSYIYNDKYQHTSDEQLLNSYAERPQTQALKSGADNKEDLTSARPVEDANSNFQISPEPPYKLHNSHYLFEPSHSKSSHGPSIVQSNGTNFQPNLLKKPIINNNLEARKRRLDIQLRTLLPTVQGWGDEGKAVQLVSKSEKEKASAVFKEGAYNVYISDRISPNRSLNSVVAKECNDIKYNVDELPNVSVIIIYTNEIFSALVRTVWSVINRTPKKLLKEIILVDDFSDRSYLKQPLRDYIDVYWNTLPRPRQVQDSQASNQTGDELVKLILLPKRLGLIKARLQGARRAKGDVLLFLDSHCEATDLWLEPLVQRIKENNRVFICPVIDIINDKTLEYNAVDPYFFQLGGFDWTGHFTWINRREIDAQREPTKSTKSPTMAGGLFAVDRKYFFEIGSYDEDMQIWGGENLELSFRVWQCGGRVEIHPCSHVGHIFRDYHPYSFDGLDSHGYNTLRTVYVWMDEFAKYFFMSRPDLLKMDPGNLTKRIELRKKLNCQSFQWYLEYVYDHRKFIYDREVIAYGFVKNDYSDLCIDVLNRHETNGQPAGLYSCEEMIHPLNVTTNQLFSYSKNREIRREEGCLTMTTKKQKHDDYENNDLDASANDEETDRAFHKVVLATCEEPEYVSSTHKKSSINKHKRQMWKYQVIPRTKGRLLINESTGDCLTTENSQSHSDLRATKCDRNDPRQLWEFQIHVRVDD